MAYWNFMTEATNPVRRNQIGPLKREDGSLAVSDKEKAHPMNKFFGTFGDRLERGSHKNIQRNDNNRSLVPSVSEINVCEGFICKKLKTLKPSKASGPEDIPPKLLKLAKPSITAPLTCLFTFISHLGEPFPNGKKLG